MIYWEYWESNDGKLEDWKVGSVSPEGLLSRPGRDVFMEDWKNGRLEKWIKKPGRFAEPILGGVFMK